MENEAHSRREEQAQEVYGGSRTLAGNEFEGPGLRSRSSWADAEGALLPSPAQHNPWPTLPYDTGMGGGVGSLGRFHGFSPTDHLQTLDHSGRRPLERPLPSLQSAGDPQRTAWQPTSLTHLARATACHAGATPMIVAAKPHLRRHSAGSAMGSTSYSFRSGGEGNTASWNVDNNGGTPVGGFGRVPPHPDHPRGSRCQPRWPSNLGPELLLNGHAPWEEGFRDQAGSMSENGARGGGPATSPPSWPPQSSNEQPCRQYSSRSTSTSTSADCSSPSIEGGRSPAIDRGVIISHGVRGDPYRASHTAAEAALARTRFSPSPSWDSASGGQHGVDGRPSQVEGGLASLVLGTDRSAGSAGAGAYMDTDCPREPFHDDRLQRGSQARAQHHRHSSLPQLTSTFAPAGSGVAPPGLGRGDGDLGLPGTGSRPLFSGMADSMRAPYPAPGLTSDVGSQAAGGVGSISFGERHGEGGRHVGGITGGDTAGGAAAGAGTAEAGSRRGPRVSDAPPTGPMTCAEGGCDERARFASKDEIMPSYCATHRRTGMVDTRHPRCKEDQCTKQPSFGLEGDRRASYCAKHKKAGMTNVTSRRCQQAGCLRNPNFGFPGDKRATTCKGHRELGMVDIVSRRCRDPSCMIRPLYNMKGLRPAFCREHKLPEMIDVISARCQEPGCVRHPSFGYVSDMKALRCARHRLENMEGVKGRRKAFRRKGTATTAADVTALPASGPARCPFISSSSSCFSSDSTPGAGSSGTGAGPTGPAGDHDCNLTKPAACRDETRGLPPSWLSVI